MINKGESKLKKSFNNTSLVVKIRLSYLLLVVPLAILILFSFYSMQQSATRYNEMISSASTAGDFSLDFKKDFDYEAYLLIVGNKSIEECELDELLTDANRVVDGLLDISGTNANQDRLKRVKKYLVNLEKYKSRIESNLLVEGKYDDNIEIWENDIQIVTSLIREEVFNYLYYEIKDMQIEREEMEQFYYRIINISMLSSGVLAVLLLFFYMYLPNSIARPINNLVDITREVSKGDLSVRANIETNDEVGELAESMNQMIDKINELLGQITKEQVRIREAELELLQSQINPHFLYNTLDTIVWLAEGNYQKEVVSMVKSLSAFFRTSISRGKEIITLGEELVHATSYLEIQRFRYQDILDYKIDVDESLNQYLIPKITIQPLIENALYHGIKNKRGGGTINVSAHEEENKVYIYVSDDGIGMTEERLAQVREGINGNAPSEKRIYGLYNVNERVRLKFGAQYGLKIESEYGKGTVSTIVLPNITE